MESFLVAPVSRASAEQRACRSGIQVDRDSDTIGAYVCNPATRRWASLTQPATPWPRRHDGAFIAFDPAVSQTRRLACGVVGRTPTLDLLIPESSSGEDELAPSPEERTLLLRVFSVSHAAAASASQVVGCSCQVRLRRRAPTTRRRELPCSPREGERERVKEGKRRRR
uniref:Uncharacterized protein n=1 Tax=Oryza glumipatula TaxID=40148 RepID=A0A0D9YHM6_9ORYZ